MLSMTSLVLARGLAEVRRVAEGRWLLSIVPVVLWIRGYETLTMMRSSAFHNRTGVRSLSVWRYRGDWGLDIRYCEDNENDSLQEYSGIPQTKQSPQG